MERIITDSKGASRTLLGTDIGIGDKAADFTVLDGNLSGVRLSDFDGKKKLISVVTSLDTGVCDEQTRRFNKEAAALGDSIVILTISVDLPFAQARWCGAAGIDAVKVLSDYRDLDFGMKFGVVIKELRLLNRSIFILDENNTLVYKEVLKDNGNHPDYEKALKTLG